ncbi:hypothetical protein GHT06_010565 [Daphnia sinensis]|uniref:Uncharacterized protein n=1 Tax=Daphnia sinensis TaxID=1820382 RepID=A0AAD5LIV4_9CRUS|nr:hypothetical protein GHT06_010565 [Daphnia sinensis]
MPSRRPPLTEEQKAEKNAKLRARRAAETAEAREKRLQEDRERKAALRIRRFNNDKMLKSFAAQDSRQRIARQQETSEQGEIRRKQDNLHHQVLFIKSREDQGVVTASTSSSKQKNFESKSSWMQDQDTSETTTKIGQSNNVTILPTVLLLILPTPIAQEVEQIKVEDACKDSLPVQPPHPVPSTQLLRLLHQHDENGEQMNLSDLELSDPDVPVKSTVSIENERKEIASDVLNQQKTKGIPCSSPVPNSVIVQTFNNLHPVPAKQPHILPIQSNSTPNLESQAKLVTLFLPPATPESLPNVIAKTKSHALSSSSRAIKPKTTKPRLILPRQSRSTPGVLLTWSFNQTSQIPLAISAVIPRIVEPSCKKSTALPIVHDSLPKKATPTQSSVAPESESLPNETPGTKSHTITLTDEVVEPKVATGIPKKTITDKSLLKGPHAAGKEISGSLHPAGVLQNCLRQEKSSNSNPAQNPGTILKSLRPFRPLRLPGSALVKDATATHPILITAKSNIS